MEDSAPAIERIPAAVRARYRPVRLLAAGGYGDVWLAEQVNLAREVALKILQADAVGVDNERKRFVDEARIAASISHPNVVIVLDHGIDDGTPWIAYEYVKGRTVRDMLVRGPLEWMLALDIARQVARGLTAAHELGVLHRDIKPDNVLEAGRQRFKITDFGIAKWTGMSQAQTHTGDLMGSPSYMPPEQIRNEVLTPAADVYALGCMLFELLTGGLPFQGHVAAILNHQLMSPPPAPSGVLPSLPKALDLLTQKAMAKEPADRFASADAFREAIDMFIGSSDAIVLPAVPAGPRPAGARAALKLPSETAVRRAIGAPSRATPSIAESRTVRVMVVSAALIVLAGLAGLALIPTRRPPPVTSPPAPPRLERVRLEPDGLEATLVLAGRPIAQRFPVPTAYPRELAFQAPDDEGVIQVASYTLTAERAAEALLEELGRLPDALAAMPADAQLNKLSRERKKLDERQLVERVRAELPAALVRIWHVIAEHARPVLASDPPTATVARVLDALQRLEDLTLRLRAFHLPPPVALGGEYPPAWRPTTDAPARGQMIEAALDALPPISADARAVLAELRAAPEVSGLHLPVHLVCAQKDVAGRPYPRDRLQGLFAELVGDWIELGILAPGPKVDAIPFDQVLPVKHRATVSLPHRARTGAAWLAMGLRPRVLASLRVTINGQVSVRLAPPQAIDLSTKDAVMACHTVDPRVLKDGENELVIEAVGVLAQMQEPPWTGFDALAIGISERR